MKDVVVGASGWISRVAVDLLTEKFGTGEDSISVYASYARTETQDNGQVLNVKLWDQIRENDKVRYFLPFAFLTVDKFDIYGEKKYRDLNYELIEKADEFIGLNKPEYCILMSSGIIHSNLSILNRPAQYQAYRELKLLEENILKERCFSTGTRLVICRLFSASGGRIRDFRKYAIANFAYQGMKFGRIQVSSPFPTYRKYVDMGQLLEICLHTVREVDLLEFDSSGSLIELHELASRIAHELNLNQGEFRVLEGETDRYYSASIDMENLAEKYEIPLFPIDKQIRETIVGVKKLMSQES
jgi:hypothetical protein